ncbi:MAG: DUF4437 domain-containing protein [Myxococcales bacterium FL481]|nr:MAG: DUF4437 domain-containing protein [Myxococcales bacterium FL481]
MKVYLGAVVLWTLGAACAAVATHSDSKRPESERHSDLEVVTISQVSWEALNPARGEMSPKAGTLWGDRNGTGATGFLVQFVDGFSSPPHIHNVTYRGVVIQGLVHNDDPTADKMWMRPGSFWTQPKGESHITAARGRATRAYIEIDQGPYLVKPTDEAFDSDERPVNLETSNVVWLDATAPAASTTRAEVAYVWGDPRDADPAGALLRLPAGYSGRLTSSGNGVRAVVIQGTVQSRDEARGDASVALAPGSYVGARGGRSIPVYCASGLTCVLYVRVEGALRVEATTPGEM